MTTIPRVALVTGQEMAKPDPETHWLVGALAARGIVADQLPWQSDCDWAAYPLVVVRTPWDYFLRREAFLDWAERVASRTRLVNPCRLLRWNSHKAYLRELAGLGVPVVPTCWLASGMPHAIELLTATGWDEVVVKPAVSIGAIGARRGRPADPELQRHVQALLQDGDVMVQPYLAEVETAGELSLIYFAGEFSHAVCKRPRPGDFRVQDMYGGSKAAIQPPSDACDVAAQVLARLPAAPTYARIDLLCHAGQWLLMEAEMIEPELFLPLAPGSAERFASAIAALLTPAG